MASDETRYTNKIFMAAALPLMKTIATDVPELKKKFEGVNAIYQVSAKVNAEFNTPFTVFNNKMDRLFILCVYFS